MPQQVLTAVENNFTKGLITEATALNFPENAATDTDNCDFSIIGGVSRRVGLDYEINRNEHGINRIGKAVATFLWTNAGGDGTNQLMVSQTGQLLDFWSITGSTAANPISQNVGVTQVDLDDFTVVGGTFDATKEATFAEGNGYLFVFHESIEPIFCTYNAGIVTGAAINLRIRDFTGIPETIPVNSRPEPASTSTAHVYNLVNQGWTQGNSWSALSTAQAVSTTGVVAFTVAAGLTAAPGDKCTSVYSDVRGTTSWSGTVTGYAGTTLTINITSFSGVPRVLPFTLPQWYIVPSNIGYISTWLGSLGVYPSNSDVWWYFKDTAGVFDPTTSDDTTLATGNAPRGHFILPAFNQDRAAASGIDAFTPVRTLKRPTVGAWFQGRVWYTGTNASQQKTGDAPFYSWNEMIFFSQVNVGTSENFGNCFQTNDPTSENLFGILPTDGGTIQIQGSGNIYKLFPVQNGMLVFAANGVWFITGSQGIGFAANDYTITKISSIQSISPHSFVDVLGMPYFWNEEGIYQVAPKQGGGLGVDSITVSTILAFFNDIPEGSKKYARGAYHPQDYVIQWIYKSEVETDTTSRYTFDRMLNYNTYNKAFYPYSYDTTPASVNSIQFISGLSADTDLEPQFKYIVTSGVNMSIGDFHDENYEDWAYQGAVDYTSYFITGYKIRGQAIRRYQPQYIQMYCSNHGTATGYTFQGLWDYANSQNSNRWTSIQNVVNGLTYFSTISRRHKIRGHGYALQFKVSSSDNLPFDIQGWAVVDTVNAGT